MFVEHVGHAQKAYSSFDDVVEHILIIDIRHATIFSRNLCEKDPRNCREVACCFTTLRSRKRTTTTCLDIISFGSDLKLYELSSMQVKQAILPK